MLLLQFFIIIGSAIGCFSIVAFQQLCTEPPQKNETLPNIKIPQTYKISGVISDYTNKNVASIVEFVKEDQIATTISDRGSSLHWIFIQNPDQRFLHNQTSNTCAASSASPLSSYRQLSLISKDISSLSRLISGVVDFSKTSQGKLLDDRVVAGVEAVHWVACVNGTNETASLQVEVIYAGDFSLEPPSKSFNNPQLLFIRVAEFGNFSEKDPKSLMSLEFDNYGEISTEDEHVFSTPPGTVCEGWKEAKIPMNTTDTFSAVVQFVDEKKLQSETLLHYSSAEQLVIVSGARQNDMMPFINEKDVPAEATSVVHDFNKGYEYALDSSRCVRLSALPNNTADVLSSAEGALTLAPILSMLIAPDLVFGNYGKVLNSDGRMLDVYRATDKKTNNTVEAYFYGVQLENYAVYKLINGVPTLLSHAHFTHSASDVVPTLAGRIRSCFTQTAGSSSESNTFTFEVKSKSIRDVYGHGVETVSSALAAALSEIAPINPFRVRVFYDTTAEKSLRVYFSIDEKTDVAPSLVLKFNYTEEVASSALIEKLNATISQGDWKFSVPTVEKKQEVVQEWVVVAKSLTRYGPLSPAPPPSYSGYTGGAMFVLGIFSLVLGVAIGAGGVFFVTKRQRISTLAYQVFE